MLESGLRTRRLILVLIILTSIVITISCLVVGLVLTLRDTDNRFTFVLLNVGFTMIPLMMISKRFVQKEDEKYESDV